MLLQLVKFDGLIGPVQCLNHVPSVADEETEEEECNKHCGKERKIKNHGSLSEDECETRWSSRGKMNDDDNKVNEGAKEKIVRRAWKMGGKQQKGKKLF